MFNEARNMAELISLRNEKEAKIVKNKKRRSLREVSEQRIKVNEAFQSRAKAIATVTRDITLP